MLITFEEHIRNLEQEEEDNKMGVREGEKRTYRKNRDAFLVWEFGGRKILVVFFLS